MQRFVFWQSQHGYTKTSNTTFTLSAPASEEGLYSRLLVKKNKTHLPICHQDSHLPKEKTGWRWVASVQCRKLYWEESIPNSLKGSWYLMLSPLVIDLCSDTRRLPFTGGSFFPKQTPPNCAERSLSGHFLLERPCKWQAPDPSACPVCHG
jgi:hypothetical protein